MFVIEVLGPVRVVIDQRVEVMAPKLTALLAALLLRGRPMSIAQLTDMVWEESQAPTNPRATIQTYVRRLRSLLGNETLKSTPGGYQLVVSPDQCDLARFRSLVGGARAQADDGRHAEAAAAFAGALALWRGDAFSGVSVAGAYSHLIEALDDERVAAREQLAAARIAAGEHAAALADLTDLVRSHPMREKPSELLIRAHHATGRRMDALAEFERLRTLYREELGLDPSPALRELHRVIVSDGAAPTRPKSPVPRQLPRLARGFTGRAPEISALCDFLGSTDQPIVAIEGTAGVGKTALGVRFAQLADKRYPDGAVFLNLRGYGPGEPVTPDRALRTLLRSIGTPDALIPSDPQERSALWRSRTAGKRMVVFLDNTHNSGHVRPLLPGPGSLTLTTTRASLTGLGARDGAYRLRLDRLPEDDAITLFSDIVGAARVDAEPAVARILVGRAAWLPLAVRVLAERARMAPTRPLADVLDELDARQDRLAAFSTEDDIDTDLRSVLSYSYAALPKAQARLWRLLALHPGDDFDAASAAALAGLTDAEGPLRGLVGAHVVERADTGRFRLHDLIRAYGLEKCRTVDTEEERTAAVRRLLDWYLGGALRAGAALSPWSAAVSVHSGPDIRLAADAIDWCGTEAHNLDAATRLAYRLGEYHHAWRLPSALHPYFLTQNRFRDGLALYPPALDATRRLDDRAAEASILSRMGTLTAFVDATESFLLHEESLSIRMELPDRGAQGESILHLAIAHHRLGRFREASDLCGRALEIARSTGDRYAELRCLAHLAHSEIAVGDYRNALDHVEESVAIEDPLPDPQHNGVRLSYLGLASAGLGRVREAIQWMERAVAAFAEIGDRFGEAGRLVLLADLHRRLDSTATAVEHLVRARGLMAELAELGQTRDNDPETDYWVTLDMFGPADEATRSARAAMYVTAMANGGD